MQNHRAADEFKFVASVLLALSALGLFLLLTRL